MSIRVSIPESIKQELLLRSKRRCALCFAAGIEGPQEGAIAHIGRSSKKDERENLVFLCEQHNRELAEGNTLSPQQIRTAQKSLYDALASQESPRREGGGVWRAYEKHVIELVRSEMSARLGDFFSLVPNALYRGRSGVSHEVDLAVEFTLAGLRYRSIFEIKYRTAPLGTQEVLRMAAVSRDLSTSKAAIVCNGGFSAAAIQLARASGIDLMKLDASSTSLADSLFTPPQ